MRNLTVTLALLLASTAAEAGAINLSGPGLPPGLSFSGPSGDTYAVGGGALTLTKGPGVIVGDSRIGFTATTSGDFDISLTLNKTYLGYVGLSLAAYDVTDGGTVSTTVLPGLDLFSDGPGQFQSYMSTNSGLSFRDLAGSASGIDTMELRRTGNLLQVLLDGQIVNSGTYDAVNPFGFAIFECSGTCISDLDDAPRIAVISDLQLSIGGAGVPEGSAWAMMMIGVGLVGASLRRSNPGRAAR